MKKGLLYVIGIVVAVLAVLGMLTGTIIDIQWFNEIGYSSVYWTRVLAKFIFFIPLFIIIFALLSLYLRALVKNYKKSKVIYEVKPQTEKRVKILTYAVIGVVSAILAAIFASEYWSNALIMMNSTSFGVTDPAFGMDVSFYMFKLPLLISVQGTIFTILMMMVFITIVFYAVTKGMADNFNDPKKETRSSGSSGPFDFNNKGNFDFSKGINLDFSKFKMKKSFSGSLSSFAGKQLAIVGALLSASIGAKYILKIFEFVYSPRGVVFGASYTDMNVTLYFYIAIIILCFVSSLIIFLSVIRSKIKPIIICGIAVVFLIVTELAVSNLFEGFYVKSNQRDLEAKYIKYNIEMTQKAFGIDDINVKEVELGKNLEASDINNNKSIIGNLKINSFKPSLQYYNQAQTLKQYYNFNDIDVDRYNIDGKNTQVFISPREVNIAGLDGNADSWQGRHLLYTHGYGVGMSKVNSVTETGRPDFVMKDLPLKNDTEIKLDNPRIYFGEQTDDYAVVNTTLGEIDYPNGGQEQTYNYTGDAGVPMTFLNRLLFAVNKQDYNLLISSNITSESKMLINRNIVERAAKVAPFLTIDEDAYPIIKDGRIYWVLDAYTSSNKYPFSEPVEDANYMRNSVKILVDAYNGTMDYYIVDKNDPIVMTYSKIYKGLFKDGSELPKDVTDHFKYPEKLFDIQSSVLGKYHIEDPNVFFSKGDLWEVSKVDSKAGAEEDQSVREGDYVMLRLPGEETEEMVILNYMKPRGKNTMASIFAGRMDGDNYGKLTLLELPTNTTVEAPQFFINAVQQDTTIAKEMTLLNSNGSEMEFGDTIIVPVEDSLLYMIPIYVKSTGSGSIPEVKRIVLGNGGNIVMGNTMEEALNLLFDMDSNVDSVSPGKPEDVNPGPGAGLNDKDKEIAKEASEKFDKMIEAQKNGDWAKYGELQKEVGELINKLKK